MITNKEIEIASIRIAGFVHKTPVFTSSRINAFCECNVYFKCENLQKVGAFKFRGAINAVSQLDEADLSKGVVTHSSGNHAQALSLAAKLFNTPAYIVMPKNAPRVKINAVKEYGGNIIFCEPTLEARENTSEEVIRKTGARFIHPFNNDEIIAGQGTCAKEFLEQLEIVPDAIIAPVGGGGLLSGTAIAVKSKSENISVFGAEPLMADDAYRSFKAGYIIPQTNPQTIADGLLTSLGDKTFKIIQTYVNDILLCQEQDIYAAMKLIFENLKMVVEPSGAVSLAVIVANKAMFKNKSVGVIISGGNLDIREFVWK
jgi:threonine dehydratase